MCVVPMTGSPPMPTRGGEAEVAQLVHHLVGQRAGLGDQPDPPGPVMSAGMMPALDLPGADQAGAVRADDAGRARARGVLAERGGVVHRDALGDHHGERDRRRRSPRPPRPSRSAAARRPPRRRHRSRSSPPRTEPKTGMSPSRRPSTVWPPLRGVTPPTTFGARREHPAGVLGALGAGDALDEDLGRPREEDRHVAAPARGASSAARSGRAVHRVDQLDQRVRRRRRGSRRPSSALLPSSRTTSGLVTASPAASSPKRLHDAVGDGVARGDAAEDVDEHRLDLRVGQDDLQTVGHDLGATRRRRCRGSWPASTPPYSSPAYATTSRVLITRPAPLPMIPTSPSSLT